MIDKSKAPMLASSEIPTVEQLVFPLLWSPKIDGVRCLQMDGQAHSRKLLPIENPFVSQWSKTYFHLLEGLDGELTVGPPHSTGEGDDVFNRTAGALRRSTGEPDFTYHVFELWNYGAHAFDRWEALQSRFEDQLKAPHLRVRLVPQVLVRDLQELKARHTWALEAGYEGSMLKHPRKMYKHGRSTLDEGILLKWKDFADSEAVVLSVNQGTTNTNPLQRDALGHAKRSSAKAGKVLKDTIGSWRVKDLYNGKVFNCPPGSQTEAELKAMWAEHLQSIANGGVGHEGRVLQYKYQTVGSWGLPRFPGMIRWMDDQTLTLIGK